MTGTSAETTKLGDAAAKRYIAFLSYSHCDDAIARWLHRSLEQYRVPSRMVGTQGTYGTIDRRLGRVFRDREDLSSGPDLGAKVGAALADSHFQIVICSPDSARSRWVNAEVLAWKRLGYGDRILCLIVAGEPNASQMPGREAEECFVPALRYRLAADGDLGNERAEPIAADLRPGKDGRVDAKLKLIAGLLDVGLDDLKQREQVRRVRRFGFATAAALVVAVITTGLAVEAMVASKAAERRQKQAETLVNFMLGDLGEKLYEVSRVDIMEKVNEQAMAYFQSLSPDDETDEALAQRAETLHKIGNVRLRQGSMSLAVEAFSAASAIAGPLADRQPKNVPFQVAYAENLTWIGFAHWNEDNLKAALEAFSNGLLILSRATALAPDDTDVTQKLAWLNNNIGHVNERRGDLQAARANYLTVLELSEKLVATDPSNRLWRSELGDAHNNLGKLALLDGDLPSAVREYVADESIQRGICLADPRDFQAKANRARSLRTLASALLLAGDVPDAVERLDRSVALLAEAAANDPDADTNRQVEAKHRTLLAGALRMSGDLEGASRQIRVAVPMLEKMSREIADNPSIRNLAAGYIEALQIHLADNDQRSAARELDKALALADVMSAWPSIDGDTTTVLADIARQRSVLAAAAHQSEPLRTHAEEVVALLDRASPRPVDPQSRMMHAHALLLLGRVSEAEPMIAALRKDGIRSPDWVALLRNHQFEPPSDENFMNQITAMLLPLE